MKQNPLNIRFSEQRINNGFLPAMIWRYGEDQSVYSSTLEKLTKSLKDVYYTMVYSSSTVVLTIYNIEQVLGGRKFAFNKQTICFARHGDHLKIKNEILDKINDGLTLKDLAMFYQL